MAGIKEMTSNRAEETHRDGRRFFPSAYWFIERLRASWVNKRWVTREEFDEIRRGN